MYFLSEQLCEDSGSFLALLVTRILDVPDLQIPEPLHLRHGEGYHNLVGDYENWDYVDAHLTPNGWKQASPHHVIAAKPACC